MLFPCVFRSFEPVAAGYIFIYLSSTFNFGIEGGRAVVGLVFASSFLTKIYGSRIFVGFLSVLIYPSVYTLLQ